MGSSVLECGGKLQSIGKEERRREGDIIGRDDKREVQEERG